MQVNFLHAKHGSGFTLVELLAALVVLGVLIGVGVPALSAMVRDARLTTFTNELHAAAFLARSEAIRRGQRVTMCASRDGLQCAADTGWESGWVIFPDVNANVLRDAGETLIRSRGPASGGMTARGNGTLARYLSYVPSGTSRTANGAMQMGTLRICEGGQQRSLIISASGRVRTERKDGCD